MKIKNITDQVIKIKLGDGKIYEFAPGKVRDLKKELVGSIVEARPDLFEMVADVIKKVKTKGKLLKSKDLKKGRKR